jgi:dihydropteroate synthase
MSQLGAPGLTLDIDRPLIMAVISATPDSFSDAGKYSTLEARMERTQEVLAQGADILDIGGQSAITGVPEISEDEEIKSSTPVIQWVAANTSAIMSIDTYRPKVTTATLEA